MPIVTQNKLSHEKIHLLTYKIKSMKVLYLTLKANFYDMIEAGIKTEEYREIKKFWVTRLADTFIHQHDEDDKRYIFKPVEFTHVHFARGGHFGKNIPQMRLELKGIEIREGKPEWGAEPHKHYFIIKLGKKLDSHE
jgi:hypothetical protein